MRAEGYYWIRRGKEWSIGYWSGNDWALIQQPDEVDEKPLTREPIAVISEIETGMLQHNGETRKSEVEVIQEISKGIV
jgi:hypothetical protein